MTLVCFIALNITSRIADAAPRYSPTDTAANETPGETLVIVAGQKLSGPNSSAQRRSGRWFLPVAAVARALGDLVTIDAQNKVVTVRRQTGVAAEFDAKLRQVRENGSVRLVVSFAGEFVFSPDQDAFYLPSEILSELLDASIRFDETANTVVVTRGAPLAASVRDGAKHAFAEIYQLDYEYGLNQYSSFSNHNLTLNAGGRIGDGRFSVMSALSRSSGKGLRFGSGTFTYERSSGKTFIIGDQGTGADLQLLSTNVRGASVQLPFNGLRLSAFAGRTFSGVYLPQTFDPSEPAEPVARKFSRFDTNIYGVLVTTNSPTSRRKAMTFSAGTLRFSGNERSGTIASGGVKFEKQRFRFQADAAAGNFDGVVADGSRVRGFGSAFDLSGSVQVTENLTLHAQYAYTAPNFLSPQAGIREPVDLKAAGVSWSPRKWLSGSLSASSSKRPGTNAQNNKYITGTLNITPRSGLPTIFFSHTQSSSTQLRSAAFTLVTASKDFSRFRIFANATRIKTIGAASVNAQLGVNVRINDSNSLEAMQGIGRNGSLNGQIDWQSAGLLKKRLDFTAGVGYSYSKNSAFTTFERVTASLRLPRQTSLQLSYTQSNAGPTIMLSLRGSLFRRNRSQTIGSSPVSELNSYGVISGRVYQDNDLNGRYDAGTDQPKANVQVRVDGNRYVVSDENGLYRVDSIKTGQHKVYIDLLSVRADLTLLDGDAQNVTLASGRDSLVDFRLVRTGRISGSIWLDTNEDGIFDENEEALAGVRVVASSGRDTLTDENGNFSIADLPPGEQTVIVDQKTLPEKFRSAPSKAVKINAGKATANVDFAVTQIPAEIKRFGSK